MAATSRRGWGEQVVIPVFYFQHSTLFCYIQAMYYVYVIKNEKENLYYGSTNDLRKRISEHNSGRNQSTKNHQWGLVYYEAFVSEEDARIREEKIKYHGQAKRWLKERIKNSLKQS